MVLSEHERRLLQEMETHLLAEDPGLASSLGGRHLRIGTTAALATSGLVTGVLLMAVGVLRARALGTLVALVGYSVLLVSTYVIGEMLRARRQRSPVSRGPAGGPRRAV
jgi:DUF3040 family protein